jgi:hypothetical protein
MTANKSSQVIDFAIIGSQKSASTAVQYYLHGHSKLYLPLGELACFESPDYERGRVGRQLDFSGAAPGQLNGIKRPTMFTDIMAVDRLKEHSPGCRMIMVCREPISRFVSHYFHMLNSSKLPVIEINRAVHEIFYGNYLSKYVPGITLLRNGIYHTSLAHIRRAYGADSIFITNQEAIKSDFESVMRDVCGFLNVPFEKVLDDSGPEKNIGRYDYRSAFFRRVSNDFIYSYSLGRSRKEYRPSRVLNSIGRSLSFIFGKWPFIKPSPTQDVLTQESKDLLKEYYSNDREKLQKDFPGVVYW